MSKEFASADYTLGQLNAIIKLLKKQAGEDGPERFLRGELTVSESNRSQHKRDGTIAINRGRFNPVKFIGQGWSTIADETDIRSAALTELDLAKVWLVTMLKDGESSIEGEVKLRRLKASGNIRLDADIFITLWENQHLIPESWKEKVNGNIRYIFFDGTILRYSSGFRFVLFLFWNDGVWDWSASWLDYGWSGLSPSAVLAS